MNPHLNLFRFFNSFDEAHLEDNLSRGFALCARYDSLFLDKVLQKVLGEIDYARLFETEFPDYAIEIDLQNRVTDLSDFKYIIGVACSGEEVAEFDGVEALGATTPETDVCIQVGDTCILFEFKRTNENCAAQLKAQVEGVLRNSPASSTRYEDLCWAKIIKILLNVSSIQKLTSTENPFTRDLIAFLETYEPNWFPLRPLRNIPFAADETSANYRLLNLRLNKIKEWVYGESSLKDVMGTHNRRAIKVDFGWINEVNISSVEISDDRYISVGFHLGDTIGQGSILFQKTRDGLPSFDSVEKFPCLVSSYVKLSNAFGKGLLSIKLSPDESLVTHTKTYFDRVARKWSRADWPLLDQEIGAAIKNWKSRCTAIHERPDWNWKSQFEDTNRSELVLSLGTHLQILIPYSDCQNLDDRINKPELANTFRMIINEVKSRIDG